MANLLETIYECIDTGRYLETFHAVVRKEQRRIILSDLLFVLRNGYHEKRHDKFDEAFEAWNYAVRGKTIDAHEMHVIISFDEEMQMLIITAFHLEY